MDAAPVTLNDNSIHRSNRFVTFEGGEGSGKTTQIARLAEYLRTLGLSVCSTREPGGTNAADALREILLSGRAKPLGAETEAVLFAAARRDHIDGVIQPALSRGEIVLCDRFNDSTRVYQGVNSGADATVLETLEKATLEDIEPVLTIVLDIPAQAGLLRASARRGTGRADRFEVETIEIHEARRQAFLCIAQSEPDRCAIVDALQSVERVEKEIRDLVIERLQLRSEVTGGSKNATKVSA